MGVLEARVLPALMRAQSDEDVEVRGNALYATGLVFANGSEAAAASLVGPTLPSLQASLQLELDSGEVVRRADGANGVKSVSGACILTLFFSRATWWTMPAGVPGGCCSGLARRRLWTSQRATPLRSSLRG